MTKPKKIELLAPAKNEEYGKYAIRYGADAVYIAPQQFGARAAAGNSIKNIENLCKYARLFDAKVYATMNTIIYDNELSQASKTASQLYEAGADALIIQDTAFLQIDMPPIALFASTQMHNYQIDRIKFLESVGISRFILARELNLSQISHIKQSTNAELEFFVHGALCVSFSGRCHISSYASGRSGNRGECSQLCRIKYDLLDSDNNKIIENKHLLSTKDLNLADYLQKLIDAGISSFKIEGRLKDETYIKNITAFYRKKLDEIINKDDRLVKSSVGNIFLGFEPLPEKSFNRGFTKYFIEGRTENVANFDTPKSVGQYLGKIIDRDGNKYKIDTEHAVNQGDGLFFVANDYEDGFYVNKSEHSWITPHKPIDIKIGTDIYRNYDIYFDRMLENDKTVRKVSVDFALNYQGGGVITITATDERGFTAEITENCEGTSKEANLDEIGKHFKKTGDTIFKLRDVRIDGSSFFFLPVSKINSARRLLLAELEEKISRYKLFSYIGRASSAEKFPASEVDFTENVANLQARAFYNKHGAKVKEFAFELLKDKRGRLLMTTKMCLKHEIGECSKFNTNFKANDNDMYLSDGKNRYRLEFSCGECVMKVYAEDK